MRIKLFQKLFPFDFWGEFFSTDCLYFFVFWFILFLTTEIKARTNFWEYNEKSVPSFSIYWKIKNQKASCYKKKKVSGFCCFGNEFLFSLLFEIAKKNFFFSEKKIFDENHGEKNLRRKIFIFFSSGFFANFKAWFLYFSNSSKNKFQSYQFPFQLKHQSKYLEISQKDSNFSPDLKRKTIIFLPE